MNLDGANLPCLILIAASPAFSKDFEFLQSQRNYRHKTLMEFRQERILSAVREL
jgi:hypothetical protein